MRKEEVLLRYWELYTNSQNQAKTVYVVADLFKISPSFQFQLYFRKVKLACIPIKCGPTSLKCYKDSFLPFAVPLRSQDGQQTKSPASLQKFWLLTPARSRQNAEVAMQQTTQERPSLGFPRKHSRTQGEGSSNDEAARQGMQPSKNIQDSNPSQEESGYRMEGSIGSAKAALPCEPDASSFSQFASHRNDSIFASPEPSQTSTRFNSTGDASQLSEEGGADETSAPLPSGAESGRPSPWKQQAPRSRNEQATDRGPEEAKHSHREAGRSRGALVS